MTSGTGLLRLPGVRLGRPIRGSGDKVYQSEDSALLCHDMQSCLVKTQKYSISQTPDKETETCKYLVLHQL